MSHGSTRNSTPVMSRNSRFFRLPRRACWLAGGIVASFLFWASQALAAFPSFTLPSFPVSPEPVELEPVSGLEGELRLTSLESLDAMWTHGAACGWFARSQDAGPTAHATLINSQNDARHWSLRGPTLPSGGVQFCSDQTGGDAVFSNAAVCQNRFESSNCSRELPQESPLTEWLEHAPACESFRAEEPMAGGLTRAWYRLRDDAIAVFQPGNVLLLSVAGGGAYAVRQTLDDDVRRATASHPDRWGRASEVLRVVGGPELQIASVAGLYLWSLTVEDEELHRFSTTLASAVAINTASTVLLKVAFHTNRPSDSYMDGKYGFPSWHTSSSFTIASVLDEYYGHEVGLPAFVVAGLVGWSRIDQREHDLSDVLFGAALGYVVGKAVSRHELCGDSRVVVGPWISSSSEAAGLQVCWTW